jgi:hypothetical protein
VVGVPLGPRGDVGARQIESALSHAAQSGR